jgi:hypothetical protein
VVAEGLTGARARGRSGEWKLIGVGEKKKGAPGVPTVGEGGWCGAGGRPTTVDRYGDGLELGAMRLEAQGGEALGGMRCGEEQRCLERLL